MCKPWGLWLKRHQVSLMWHWDGLLLVQMFKSSSTTFIVFFLNIYIIYMLLGVEKTLGQRYFIERQSTRIQ
jgi:hypothetical protein